MQMNEEQRKRIWRIALVAADVVILLAVLIGFGVLQSKNSTSTAGLDERLSSVKEQLSAIASDQEALSESLSALQESVSAATLDEETMSELHALAAGYDGISEKVDGIAASLEETEGQAALQEDMTAIKKQNADNREAIDEILRTVQILAETEESLTEDPESAAFREEVSALGAASSEQQQKIDALEAGQGAQETKLAAIEEEQDAQGTKLAAVEEEQDAQKTKLAAVERKQDVQEKSMASLVSGSAGLAESMEGLRTAMDDPDDGIATNLSAIRTDLASLGDKLDTVSDTVNGKLDAFSEEANGRLDQMAEAVSEGYADMTVSDRLDSLDEQMQAIGNSTALTAEKLEDLGEALTDTAAVDDLAKKLDDMSGQLSSTAVQLGTKLDEAAAGFGTKVDDAVTDLGTKVDDAVTDLGTKVDDAAAGLGRKVDKSGADLGTKLDDTAAALETKLEDTGKEINNRIGASSRSTGLRMNAAAENADAKLSEVSETMLGKMDEVAELVSSAVGDVSTDGDLSAQLTGIHETLVDWRESEAAETETDPIIEYKVKSGDTVLSICRAKGIDYYENKELLQELNDKENLSLIEPGEILILPDLSAKNRKK